MDEIRDAIQSRDIQCIFIQNYMSKRRTSGRYVFGEGSAHNPDDPSAHTPATAAAPKGSSFAPPDERQRSIHGDAAPESNPCAYCGGKHLTLDCPYYATERATADDTLRCKNKGKPLIILMNQTSTIKYAQRKTLTSDSSSYGHFTAWLPKKGGMIDRTMFISHEGYDITLTPIWENFKNDDFGGSGWCFYYTIIGSCRDQLGLYAPRPGELHYTRLIETPAKALQKLIVADRVRQNKIDNKLSSSVVNDYWGSTWDIQRAADILWRMIAGHKVELGDHDIPADGVALVVPLSDPITLSPPPAPPAPPDPPAPPAPPAPPDPPAPPRMKDRYKTMDRKKLYGGFELMVPKTTRVRF